WTHPALPKSRRATTRPATRTAGASARVASSSSPKRAWTAAARWSGRKSFGYGIAPRARRAPSFRRLTTICSWSSGMPTRSKVDGFYWVRRSRTRNDDGAVVEDEERRARARADQVRNHCQGVRPVHRERAELLDRDAVSRRRPGERDDGGRRRSRVARRHHVRPDPVETRRRRRADQPPEKHHVATAHDGSREAAEGSAPRRRITRADEHPEGFGRGEEEPFLAALIEHRAEAHQRVARGRRIEGVEVAAEPSRSAAALAREQQQARAATQDQPRLVTRPHLRHEPH